MKMQSSRFPNLIRHQSSMWRALLPALWLAILLFVAAAAIVKTSNARSATSQPTTEQSTPRQQNQPASQLPSLSAAEFSRVSRECSEEGGFFRSDNFTSNETSYLHIVDKLRQLGATGGAYLGVGPEQNFTYIAKIRPRIAFIIDIRRQAILQHLMYKAVFQLSPTRTQFLSRLLSRQLPKEKEKVAALEASVTDMVNYFSKTPSDDQVYTANLAEIRKMIQQDFQFPLSESDQAGVEYVYKSFRNQGLGIAYQMGGVRGGGYPDLGDLILETDLHGKMGNFLAVTEDYEFVRDLHRRNMIIPVVGDFGGKKALAAVGDYLRKNGYTVTAYYTSNVEQYLFESGIFGAFANNIKKLPLTDKSLFIRAAPSRYAHPARLPNHRSATLLELMTIFVRDFDEGLYPNYPDLLLTHYIAAER